MTTLDCHAVVRRLWDYLDGALDAAELRAVDEHLAQCDRCPPHFTFERAFLRAVRSARAEHEDPTTLRARVVASLGAEGYVPSKGGAS